MAALFGVTVSMPERQTGWQPAMVRTVGNAAMVEVNLRIDRARVCPGFGRDPRVQLFMEGAEIFGARYMIAAWNEVASQFFVPVKVNRFRVDNG